MSFKILSTSGIFLCISDDKSGLSLDMIEDDLPASLSVSTLCNLPASLSVSTVYNLPASLSVSTVCNLPASLSVSTVCVTS